MRAWVEIPASKSGVCVPVLLDLEDVERIGTRRISVASHGYAQICLPESRVGLLHRWLLGLQRGDGLIGDHRNGNPLDNRRANLRAVTPSGSSQNVAGRGKSRYRGVHPSGHGRWCARVKFQGVTHFLGTYDTEEEAAVVADKKRRELMPFYVPPEERAA